MHLYHILIDKFLDKTISREERKVLEQWVLESENNRAFFKKRIKESNQRATLDFDWGLAYHGFLRTIQSKKPKARIPRTLYRYAAVFVVLLTIGFLAKKAFVDTSADTSLKVVEGQGNNSGENNIVIKLTDGSTKLLTTQGDEVVMDTKGNVVASKEGHSLTFGSDNPPTLANVFNEIYIPYGQTFKLKLSDGTLVWLNAGSRLRFPQYFTAASSTRTVYLEGEAFFDVTRNEEQPFIVNTHEVDIKVLGTKFNISSYVSDSAITTTLVEGAVSVYETRVPENELRLTPSFQAAYDKFGNSFRKSKVDTGIYTAWMENKLVIDNLRFSEILKKLERMHNVTFVNKARHLNKATYKGEFENESIESILKTISLSTPFTYEMNHNIITITE